MRFQDFLKNIICQLPMHFHAGDGNLHPLIMFDANDKEVA